MNTPIADFCKNYNESDTVRLHMPGHKGTGPLGAEALDITEICGADSLYEADGIILESENNASELFNTRHTYYSAGGSSQSIKAMHLLAYKYAAAKNKPGSRLSVLAGRNAHRAYVQAMQLIGFDTVWYPSEDENFSLCRCRVTPDGLRAYLESVNGTEAGRSIYAVYVTSPDYLGGMLDIEGLAKAAHEYGKLLLVDNAHGAYLKFMPKDRHPMTLGADMCADSAHKTLPVLTGGSYLHISKNAPKNIEETARDSMVLFGSTSPSYLILQSMDLCNKWLVEEGRAAFAEAAERTDDLRSNCEAHGLVFYGNEKLKLTLNVKASGFTDGRKTAESLRNHAIEIEYADPDYAVMMFSPGSKPEDYSKAEAALLLLAEQGGAHRAEARDGGRPGSNPACSCSHPGGLTFTLPEQVVHPREALLLPSEEIAAACAEGRIAADAEIGCPPAVSPVAAGERITAEAVRILEYYGIERIRALKEA